MAGPLAQKLIVRGDVRKIPVVIIVVVVVVVCLLLLFVVGWLLICTINHCIINHVSMS
jgi:hypothetical protein